MILGIDLSTYDTPINLLTAKMNGVQFAYNRITWGSKNGYILNDDKWAGHYQKCVDAGILIGAYHFFQSDIDPIAQAKKYIDECARYEKIGAYVLDTEDYADSSGYLVAGSKISARSQTFVRYIEDNAPKKPIWVYTADWFVRGYSIDLLNWITNYPLMLAYYPSNFPHGIVTWNAINAALPSFPPSVLNNTLLYGLKNKWKIWQISDKTKPSEFIDYPDIDVFNGTMEELKKLFGAEECVPPPEEITLESLDARITGLEVEATLHGWDI